MSHVHEAVLELDGATLSYDVTDGSGPAVVALHGLTSSRRNELESGGYFGWSEIADSGRRLVRYDARGHGRSTGRAVPADYAWPRLADDLFRLLDVVSPDEPVDAIGVSMGTGTLLHGAALEPERFRRLALVIAPTAWATRAAQGDAYRQMAALVERQGLAALAGMQDLPPLPILEAGGWLTMPAPDIAEALLPTIMRGAADTDLPTPDAIRSIRHPVLLRPWADDPGHPVVTSEVLLDLLPDATLELMREPEDLRSLGSRVARFFS
jgi:pimeloyl-ACP methyl ester carboxylesterase